MSPNLGLTAQQIENRARVDQQERSYNATGYNYAMKAAMGTLAKLGVHLEPHEDPFSPEFKDPLEGVVPPPVAAENMDRLEALASAAADASPEPVGEDIEQDSVPGSDEDGVGIFGSEESSDDDDDELSEDKHNDGDCPDLKSLKEARAKQLQECAADFHAQENAKRARRQSIRLQESSAEKKDEVDMASKNNATVSKGPTKPSSNKRDKQPPTKPAPQQAISATTGAPSNKRNKRNKQPPTKPAPQQAISATTGAPSKRPLRELRRQAGAASATKVVSKHDSDVESDEETVLVESIAPSQKKTVDLWEDSSDEGVTTKTEAGATKAVNTKKKARGNRRRTKDVPPFTWRQQHDQKARINLKSTKEPIRKLQQMTLPISRQDGFVETADNADQVLTERSFPWVIHGAICLDEQVPNGDGNNGGRMFLKKPQLKVLVGSKLAKKHLKEVIKSSNFEFVLYTDFDEYEASFRSDSARNKSSELPAEPQQQQQGSRKRSSAWL